MLSLLSTHPRQVTWGGASQARFLNLLPANKFWGGPVKKIALYLVSPNVSSYFSTLPHKMAFRPFFQFKAKINAGEFLTFSTTNIQSDL